MSENVIKVCEVCRKPSTLKCSACKQAYYCCVEHQKDHWNQHKDICRPFEVCESAELGRYLRATRDLVAGDVIFTEAPLVFGPKPHLIEATPFPCVGCCRLIDETNCHACPDCSWPTCSPDCAGLKLPTVHSFECRILRLRPRREPHSFLEYFRFDVLIILRALCLQKTNKAKWEALMKLQHHQDERGPGTDIFKTVQEKVVHLQQNYLNPLKEYEEESGQTIIPEVSVDLIHKIYGIFDVNATELSDEVDAEILYGTASLVEHNCTPNTYQTIDRSDKYRVTFRAAQPIKRDEHIKSIYTHILWGTHARRQHLKQTKYFTCCCQRCADSTELGTFLSALKCVGTEQEPCGGMQLPANPLVDATMWICDKCHINLPNEDIMKFVSHLSELVDKALAVQPTNLQELEDVLGKLLNFLHPNHHLVYSIKHSLVQLYGAEGIELSTGLLNEKLKMCDELIEITRKIDPGNARLSMYLGVLLNEQTNGRFTKLSRDFEVEHTGRFMEEVQWIRDNFQDNKSVLQNELESESGRKLFEVVCGNERKFSHWLLENHINDVEPAL